MATIVEVLDELEKTRLAPIVLPALRIADPVLGALPRGCLQSILSSRKTRDSLVRTVESLSPVLPDIIRFLGHVSESKIATGLFSFWAAISVPVMKLLAPAVAKLVVPGSGPALNLAGRSGSILPPLIKVLDGMARAELYLERPLKHILSSYYRS